MNDAEEWEINFKDHVVVVTGSGSGIGLSIAEEFIKTGATVIGAELDEKTLDDASKMLGEKFFPRQCDITVEDEILSLMQYVDKSFGKLDVLVNNAGRARYVPPDQVTEGDFSFHYDVFVKGPILMAKNFIPLLRKSSNPNIINIGSLNGIHRFEADNAGVYGSSKAAMEKYTRYLARELPGIRSNVVHPGAIDTPVYKTFGIDQEQKEMIFEGFKKKIPCRRIGQSQDIANCVLFLCSEKASYINGTSILVDGGWSTGADWGW